MRAQVVLLADGRILLAKHERADECYWVLPGGGVEPGETPEEAAVREVKEETGLEIRLERLLFVDGPRVSGSISIKQPRYTYLGTVIRGRLECVPDGLSNDSRGHLTAVEWMPFEHLTYDERTRDTLELVRGAVSLDVDGCV